MGERKNTSPNSGQKIAYVYDASGTKLRQVQIAVNGTVTKTTDYIGAKEELLVSGWLFLGRYACLFLDVTKNGRPTRKWYKNTLYILLLPFLWGCSFDTATYLPLPKYRVGPDHFSLALKKDSTFKFLAFSDILGGDTIMGRWSKQKDTIRLSYNRPRWGISVTGVETIRSSSSQEATISVFMYPVPDTASLPYVHLGIYDASHYDSVVTDEFGKLSLKQERKVDSIIVNYSGFKQVYILQNKQFTIIPRQI